MYQENKNKIPPLKLIKFLKMIKSTIFLFIFFVFSTYSFAQEVIGSKDTNKVETKTIAPDTLSKFTRFNKKAEALFKVLPFPMVSYSTETGTVVGLAKYNMVQLVEGDTISAASSFSGLASASTEGHYKVVLGGNLYLDQNKLILNGTIQYIVFPEYLLGIGNNVQRENLERIITERFAFTNYVLHSIDKQKHLYAGVFQEYKNYYKITKDTVSWVEKNKYPGYEGGITSGFGLGIAYDTRDHKYNAMSGMFASFNAKAFTSGFGSDFNYNSIEFEFRKFFNPWYKHVIAFQLYSQGNYGNIPFYSLGQIGGTNRMRGYYLGAIRDKVIADAQVEYRMKVWSIFGVTAFASAGRVAGTYSEMDLNDLWYAAGFGLRIMVDSAHKANLRVDFGYGMKGSKTVVIGFAEAF